MKKYIAVHANSDAGVVGVAFFDSAISADNYIAECARRAYQDVCDLPDAMIDVQSSFAQIDTDDLSMQWKVYSLEL